MWSNWSVICKIFSLLLQILAEGHKPSDTCLNATKLPNKCHQKMSWPLEVSALKELD